MTTSSRRISPFNSPFETGFRSTCLLAVDLGVSLDLQQLSAFDYLVVHTGDFESAPPSLHPQNPTRNGELVIRRQLVERGLQLMESKNLIQKKPTSDGFTYSATELAEVVVSSMQAPYIVLLRERANWIVKNYLQYEANAFPIVFNRAFGQWTTEFQFEEISLTTR